MYCLSQPFHMTIKTETICVKWEIPKDFEWKIYMIFLGETNLVEFTVTCQEKIGSVDRDFILGLKRCVYCNMSGKKGR